MRRSESPQNSSTFSSVVNGVSGIFNALLPKSTPQMKPPASAFDYDPETGDTLSASISVIDGRTVNS